MLIAMLVIIRKYTKNHQFKLPTSSFDPFFKLGLSASQAAHFVSVASFLVVQVSHVHLTTSGRNPASPQVIVADITIGGATMVAICVVFMLPDTAANGATPLLSDLKKDGS